MHRVEALGFYFLHLNLSTGDNQLGFLTKSVSISTDTDLLTTQKNDGLSLAQVGSDFSVSQVTVTFFCGNPIKGRHVWEYTL